VKKIKKTFLRQISQLLTDQKDELLQAPIVKQSEVDTDGDEIDVIQGNMLIELNNQLSGRNVLRLSQIEIAQKQIQEGKYGLCIDCEEPIPEKRLLSNPCFQTCVVCAEDREREEKQRRKVAR
jgi:DnaK suppressor protein